jgi:hypothetical protein
MPHISYFDCFANCLFRLVILTPHHSPYTSFVDCADTYVDCANTSANYTKTSTKSADTTNIPTLDFYVTDFPFYTPGPSHYEITILIFIIIVQEFARHSKF